MKRRYCLLILFMSLVAWQTKADSWIRINQLGYLPHAVKVAVFMSEEPATLTDYSLIDAFTGEEVQRFNTPRNSGAFGRMQTTYRLDFSSFTGTGVYYLKAGNSLSPRFSIHAQVYHGTADFLLNYMRQQRCGYNPFLKDSCHVHDGYIVYHPSLTGKAMDVRGGWHDATDYLQYTTTSANAIYQMMFAYEQNPEAFGDAYDADGRQGANGIPDIVDEIKWGLDWLNRMNPAPGELYNQIADDRDHAGMRLPGRDRVDYGYGPGNGRPVYFCSGEPQVRGKFLNATTGVASTAGKFASCFALGARLLKEFYPEFAAQIAAKAAPAYQEGVRKPGVCQTASVVSPYIYEEDNWTDDMELAAMELYQTTGRAQYLQEAIEYGRREPVTPWMGADSARHYQWYPFMNMGHYQLAKSGNERIRNEFIRNLHAGIRRTYEKALESPFLHGIPYIWCSNNLTVAMLTQCRLYRELTGDDTYQEMEASLRDWLFGCNPWGTSMVVELPLYGTYPTNPHSSLLNAGVGNTTGGLVDGPVYRTIFESLRGVNLNGVPNLPGEAYTRFQPDLMVYHDVINDYSTNEPTMDGTACLTYYLSALQKEGMKQMNLSTDRNVYVQNGIIRTNPLQKRISLVFTAADQADGAESIMKTLKKEHIKGGFFFTGEFYERFPNVVKQLREDGHYVGSHSYGHLLYMPWENRDSLLISRREFEADMLNSYQVMRKAGIRYQDAPLYIPPYEYYNRTIAAWAKSMGIQVVNYTPGTMTNADYTTPDMPNYRSSQAIYDKVMKIEKEKGLNGYILLIHLGTNPLRTDKFYHTHLDKMIKTLKKRGYTFAPIQEAITN
ncbi:MAG: glycoside hydrolase family 9 protein [Prevotellaceae bacterium]|jgi:peptidoglycan/xylan/chitin deacetylase (PgdA/CDA1 family)|nr:glycoside hydrolase family 9 protein [Prevotellaceae bacterium]